MEKVKNVQLFQFAIVFNPTMDPQSKKKEQEKPTLLHDITTVLAKDDSEAKILASKSIPAEYEDRLEEVDVIVVPFD